ncbi:MAG: DegT/DnrJ/EryC1/StrS family aminotransferase [Synergistaceae bacterium]|nr:DegT/DnrJ/EryC1/StrS family aminotransferase [Synergistaceae bacterium]
MPGFEIFDQKEIDAVADVIKRKMVHRYSFVRTRDEIYRCEEFENAVAAKMGAKHCLAVSNGSAALFVALKASGLEPGDEVITTPFTFIASVEALLECGLVPVLAEIDETLNLDPKSVEDYITDRTRAIMPVHMMGASADMDAFSEICTDHGLYLFEDACQAIGVKYHGKCSGTMGKWGTYSLDPYKVLTVGEGGLILTDDESLYRRMEYYHDHGHMHSKQIERGAEGKACLGFNFRMSEIQGAMGLVQLSKLDAALERMKNNRDRILNEVGNIEGLKLRKCPDADGEAAMNIIYLLPDAASARKFQSAAKEIGAPCGNFSDNTWHYARHWEVLREYSAKVRAGSCHDCGENNLLPLYRPNEWPVTHSILERTAVFGIDICMSDESISLAAKAIKAGAKAAGLN